MADLNKKFDYLEVTKTAIRESIANKGVEISDKDTFRSYADKINNISSGGGGGELLPLMGVEADRLYIEAGSITHQYSYLNCYEFMVWLRDRRTGSVFRFSANKILDSSAAGRAVGKGFVYPFLKEKGGAPGTSINTFYTSVPLNAFETKMTPSSLPAHVGATESYWDKETQKSGTIIALNTYEDTPVEVVGITGWAVASSTSYVGDYSLKIEFGKTPPEAPEYELFQPYEVVKEVVDYTGLIKYGSTATSTSYKTNGISIEWLADGFTPPATLEEPFIEEEEIES